MSSRPHEPDLKNIWQNQETEKATMSIEEVRFKAGKYLRRKQLDMIARSAFVMLAAVSCGLFLMNARITSLRFVAGLVMAILLISTVWSLLKTYMQTGTGVSSNAAMTSCIEFYRSELERYREYARLPAWQLATILLIIAWMTRDSLMRSRSDPFRIVLPYVLIAAAGMIVLVAVRKIQSRRIQADIDALDVFEDEMLAGGRHGTAVDEHQK
jgi:hypothetical protein